ncbi:Helix-turn-helix domain protein [Streptomyces sp. YIM 130001]|uniref:ArsR/SmtB family transcription factor n=1 Tax=Streptomyces sp. YIM 130001 TaxID=2259644 RepID=UPI000EDCE670|nr:helix-turn-helix domain-containing protein [Streptomyces sp. YIM 130001]RII19787.1 Helix-turn-helix domain protein [Streptomyces sp. YIM 130001]
MTDSRDLDPRSLRGLAHPLRMRLLAVLRDDGPATASQLAARLDESSGSTSYHLRQLARHRFVTEEPGRGKGRERWWRAVHHSINSDTEDFYRNPDPEVRGAVNTLLYEMATGHAQELGTYLGTMHERPEWIGGAIMSDWTLKLTIDQARALKAELLEVIGRYESPGTGPETGAGAGTGAVARAEAGPGAGPDGETGDADEPEAAVYRLQVHGYVRPRASHHPAS